MPEADYNELSKEDILELYKRKSDEHGIEPHVAFVTYLERTYNENEALDIVIHGNHKYMFMDRIKDNQLIVICETLKQYAIYIEDVDLRYN